MIREPHREQANERKGIPQFRLPRCPEIRDVTHRSCRFDTLPAKLEPRRLPHSGNDGRTSGGAGNRE